MQLHRARILPASARGQSAVELLVLLGIVVGLFALPYGGSASLAQVFTDAIGIGFDCFLAALSLPQ